MKLKNNHQITNICWFNGGNMNTPNNKKRKNSQEKIEKVFIELIQTKEIYEISITDICKKANINRTTFYSNYIKIAFSISRYYFTALGHCISNFSNAEHLWHKRNALFP